MNETQQRRPEALRRQPTARARPKKAIALQYEAGRGEAPTVTAVGKGAAAERIIEAAKESGVARVEDEFQADVLGSLDAGSRVPKFLYDLVAEVLLFVEEADTTNLNGGVLH